MVCFYCLFDEWSQLTYLLCRWFMRWCRVTCVYSPCGWRTNSQEPFYWYTRKTRRCEIWGSAVHYGLSNAILTDYLITLVSVCPCVCVCPPIDCRTITSAILYWFSPNFERRSEMWLFRTLLFLGQTGSSLPILEMCKVRFWQFCNCDGHIFPRIVTKTPNEI